MKIQKLPNGEIQITFRPEEITNFQTALPLEEIENVFRFEDCMHKVKFKTRDFLKELRDIYGIGNDINRNDKRIKELRYQYEISDVTQVLKLQEQNGLISLKRVNENNDITSKILTFKFNF
jgi:hypothetical protein